MLTPTPILGLRRWESTDEFDVAEVNANSDDLDSQVLPRVGRKQSAAGTIAVAASTDVWITTVNTVVYNKGGIAYTTGIYTVNVTGLYRWEGTVNWAAAALSSVGPGRRRIQVRVDGVKTNDGIDDEMLETGQSLNSNKVQSSGGTIALTSGQTVQMGVFQSSGNPLSLEIGTIFSLYLVA